MDDDTFSNVSYESNDVTIDAVHIRENLIELDLQYFNDIENNKFKAELLFIGYLCCCGKYLKVLKFLSEQTKEMQIRFLNEKFTYFWNGTILHILLMWNSDSNDSIYKGSDIILKPIDIYKALRKMGAKITINDYNLLPYQQTISCCWMIPGLSHIYGERNGEEFLELYNKIIDWETQPIHEKFYDWTDPLSKN